MTLGVFFPSLMGFGILVSGALIVYDLVHRMLPHETTRRRRRLAVGAHAVVSGIARTAGISFPAPGFLVREPRSRLAYILGCATTTLLAALVVVAGSAAYADTKGLFYESPWILGLTIGFGIAIGLVALVLLFLSVMAGRAPQPFQWLIRSSPFGRLRIPAPADAMGSLANGGEAT